MPFEGNLYSDFPGELGVDVAVGDIIASLGCDGAGNLIVNQDGTLTYNEAPGDAGNKVTCNLTIEDEAGCGCTDEFDLCINVPAAPQCIEVCLRYHRENDPMRPDYDPGDVGYGHYKVGMSQQSPNGQNYQYTETVCVFEGETIFLTTGLTGLGNYQIMPVAITAGMGPVSWFGHSLAICEEVNCSEAPDCYACADGTPDNCAQPLEASVSGLVAGVAGPHSCHSWFLAEIANLSFGPVGAACHWYTEVINPGNPECILKANIAITSTMVSLLVRLVDSLNEIITYGQFELDCESIECARKYSLVLIDSSSPTSEFQWSAATAQVNHMDAPPVVPCGGLPFEAIDDEYTAIIGQTTCHDIVSNDIGFDAPDVSLSNAGGGTAGGMITFNNGTGQICYTPLPSECGMDVTVNYQVINTLNTNTDTATVLIHVTTHAIPDPPCDGSAGESLNFSTQSTCWEFSGFSPSQGADFNCFIGDQGGPGNQFSPSNVVFTGYDDDIQFLGNTNQYALSDGCHLFERYPSDGNAHTQAFMVNGPCQICSIAAQRHIGHEACAGFYICGCIPAMPDEWYNTIGFANIFWLNAGAGAGNPILHVFIDEGEWFVACREGDPAVSHKVGIAIPFVPGNFCIQVEVNPQNDFNGYAKVSVNGTNLWTNYGPIAHDTVCNSDAGLAVGGSPAYGLYCSTTGLPAEGAKVVICNAAMYVVSRGAQCSNCDPLSVSSDDCNPLPVTLDLGGIQNGSTSDPRVMWAIDNHWFLSGPPLVFLGGCAWRKDDIIPASEAGGGTVFTDVNFTATKIVATTELRDQFGVLIAEGTWESTCVAPYECDGGYVLEVVSTSGPTSIDFSGAVNVDLNAGAPFMGVCN